MQRLHPLPERWSDQFICSSASPEGKHSGTELKQETRAVASPTAPIQPLTFCIDANASGLVAALCGKVGPFLWLASNSGQGSEVNDCVYLNDS